MGVHHRLHDLRRNQTGGVADPRAVPLQLRKLQEQLMVDLYGSDQPYTTEHHSAVLHRGSI